MSYRGDINLGDTIDIKFCTVTTTGAPTQLAGTPVISAYPDNSITQLTAGITLTVDFDGVTGLNNVRVVASGANGYATATNVALVITTGTVDSVSVVGEVVGTFSIENRSALMPTTAARTLDVSAGGEAGVDWANVGSPTTAQNLSATNIDVDQVVASVSGAVGSVAAGGITAASIATDAIDADALAADAVAEIADGVWDEDATGHQTLGTFGQAIGDPVADSNTIYGAVVTGAAGATIAADIIAVKADTAAILLDTAEIGAAGAGLTNIGTIATVTTLTNKTGFALAATGLDAIGAAATGVQAIVDAVWNEDVDTGHQTAGTAGKKLDDAGGAADPWATTLPGAYGAGTAGKIVGDNVNAPIATRATPAQVLTTALT